MQLPNLVIAPRARPKRITINMHTHAQGPIHTTQPRARTICSSNNPSATLTPSQCHPPSPGPCLLSRSAPPYVPQKPVPRLVPLPPCHTLPVKRKDRLDAQAFGALREDNLQLVITANVRRLYGTLFVVQGLGWSGSAVQPSTLLRTLLAFCRPRGLLHSLSTLAVLCAFDMLLMVRHLFC